MKTWQLNQISNEEKNDILGQHRSLYDGYRALNNTENKLQPLYVQDFAKDKGGAVVNNKGQIKTYTNFGINESLEEKEECMECGSSDYLEEKEECMECGSSDYLEEKEECMECGEMEEFKDIRGNHPEKDLGGGKFDYVQEYDKMESAWSDLDEEETNESWGTVARIAAPIAVNYIADKLSNEGEEESNEEEEIEYEETELSESFIKEKQRIVEMMSRMSSFN